MTESWKYREAAYNFEAVKVGMSQTKDGTILRISVHPNDCPAQLLMDMVGTRYGVAMVAIADDETPLHMEKVEELRKLKASAGALCREVGFQNFLGAVDEESAVEILREKLGVKSRAEFDDNEAARGKFIDLREEFKTWLKNT